MNSSLAYTPCPDATPEAELDALAACYRFILDCHERKRAAEPAPEPDGRNDGIKIKEDSAGGRIPSN